MNIKTDLNLSENCMHAWTKLFKEYLSKDKLSVESYYEIKRIDLSSEMKDVYRENCMIKLLSSHNHKFHISHKI